MTYNALADALVNFLLDFATCVSRTRKNVLLSDLCVQAYEHAQNLYSHVHRSVLRFDNRIAQIMNEIRHLLPDVLSLQEVDRPEDFVHSLSKLG